MGPLIYTELGWSAEVGWRLEVGGQTWLFVSESM